MTLGPDYFDELYSRRDDPWRLAERWYEKRKRALTLAALPHERYSRALEIGCSIGTLSAELAPRCDSLVAVDVSARAVDLARERLLPHPHVRAEVRNLPDDWPQGQFDLIVVSEVGYYFDEAALAALVDRCAASLIPDGVLLACHWRHPVDDYPLDGDRVHDLIRAAAGLTALAQYLDDDVRLEVFARGPGESVAQREGLVSSP
jgi:SAM-dependent methyltransferase